MADVTELSFVLARIAILNDQNKYRINRDTPDSFIDALAEAKAPLFEERAVTLLTELARIQNADTKSSADCKQRFPFNGYFQGLPAIPEEDLDTRI